VTPYWSGKSVEDFAHGANFAVAGATALSPEFFWERGYAAAEADTVHLDQEMNWFRDLLDLLCPGDLSGTLTTTSVKQELYREDAPLIDVFIERWPCA
jgi:hypothetical protein